VNASNVIAFQEGTSASCMHRICHAKTRLPHALVQGESMSNAPVAAPGDLSMSAQMHA
jgi:hypothetical protein